MPPSCCVPFCRSSKSNVSFHQFPSDENLCKLWLKNISRKNFGINEAYEWSRLVCSGHFKESDFIEGLKVRKLKKGTVPTIFPDYPKYMQPKQIKKRKTRQQNLQQPKQIRSRKTKHRNLEQCLRYLEPPPSKMLKGASTLEDASFSKSFSHIEEYSLPVNCLGTNEIENNFKEESVPNAVLETNNVEKTFGEESLSHVEPLEENEVGVDDVVEITAENIQQMKGTIVKLRCRIQQQNQKLQHQQEIIGSLQNALAQFSESPRTRVQELVSDANEDEEAIVLLKGIMKSLNNLLQYSLFNKLQF